MYVDRGRDACAHRRRAERGGEPVGLEQLRVDPLGQPCRFVQRLLHVARHLFKERLRASWIRVDQWAGELQLDREGDKVLLHAVVQVTLDRATVGVAGQNEPCPRRAQPGDLRAKTLELVAP